MAQHILNAARKIFWLCALVLLFVPALYAAEDEKQPRISRAWAWVGLAATSIALAATQDRATQGKWPASNALTKIGNAWGLIAPLALAAMRFPKDREAAWRYLEAGALAAVAAGVVKVGVGRARPERRAGPWRFRPGSLRDAWHAFPSGHTSFAAAAAGAALADDGAPLWLKGAAVSLALTTAYARVAKRRHWLSDVTAGLWLGGAIGLRTMKDARWWLGCGKKRCGGFVAFSF